MNKFLISILFTVCFTTSYADEEQDRCIAQFSTQCQEKCQETTANDCAQRCQEDAINQCRQAGE